MKTDCSHQGPIKNVSPIHSRCQECQAEKGTYVSARVCRTCGHVGCCDSSPKRHAREHFHKTGHAILSDLSDSWRWCYECNDYVKN